MLPLIKITGLPSVDIMQTKWKSELDPVLSNPLLAGIQLPNIFLINGTTTINHLLGRKMVGWFITDQNAGTTIFRSEPLNDKTLTLTAGANVTVNLWVY